MRAYSRLQPRLQSRLMSRFEQEGIGGALDFNFAGAPSLESNGVNINWSRASSQSRFNAAGKLEYVPANTPAFAYDPATGRSLGVQIYEGKAELITASEDLTDSAWTATDTTVTANQAVAPDGTLSMVLLTEGTGGSATFRHDPVVVSSGAVIIHSRFIRRGDHDWIRMLVTPSSGTTNFVRAWFNLATGAVGSVTEGGIGGDGTSGIEDVGNGIYRCWMTASLSGETDYYCWTSSADDDASTTRVNNGARYEWGANATVGSVLKPYNPARGGGLFSDPIDMTGGAWSTTDTTPMADQTVAPDGTTTADLLIEGTSGSSALSQAITVPSGAIVVVSRFIKRGGATPHDWIKVRGSDNVSSWAEMWADIANCETGSTVTSGGGSYVGGGVMDVGNGWCLVWMVFSIAGETTYYVTTRSAASDGVTTRVDNGTRYEWGAHGAIGTSLNPVRDNEVSQFVDRNDSSQSSWNLNQDTTVIPHATEGPYGDLIGAEFEHIGAGGPRLGQSIPINPDTYQYISFLVKYKSAQWVRIILQNGAFNSGCSGWFDVLNGVKGTTDEGGTSDLLDHGIEYVANGWYRIYIVGLTDAVSTTGSVLLTNAVSDGGSSSTANSNYVCGATIHQATGLNYYSSGITQSDDAVISGISPFFNPSSGTIFAEAFVPSSSGAYGPLFNFTDGDDGNDMIEVFREDNALAQLNVNVGGVQQAKIGTTTLTAAGEKFRVAGAFTANDFAVCVNGGTVEADASGSLPTVNQANIGSRPDSTFYWNGTISRIVYWPHRLPDGSLLAITQPNG